MNQSYRLTEIDVMRPIVIVLLVLMHSFVIFNPAATTWPLPNGIHDIPAYHWIQEISFSFLLEAFTLISGYVFGYAIYGKGKTYTFMQLFSNKFKRLIIPSLVFSLLYTPLFYNKDIELTTYLYDLVCGIGHMWYLPMLFGVFILTWFIQKIRINEHYKLIFLLLLAIISVRIPSLFRMNTICYYLFFFYLGLFLYQKKKTLSKLSECYHLFVLGYVITIIPLLMLHQNLLDNAQTAIGGGNILIYKILAKIIMIIYSTIGTIALYLSCLKWSKNNKASHFIVEANSYCMGIYLLQQFLLKFMYYYTNLPIVGSYILPFLAFIIALVSSYYITRISCKYRIGRFLLE